MSIPSTAGAQDAERSSFASRPTILLAEDDPVSLAFLAEALRGLGLDVGTVSDGDAALIAARTRRFDVLMLDHHLPRLDGDAALRTLRADAGAASCAALAIATTADPDPAIHARLRAAGFARVLVKPLDAAGLRKSLDALGIARVPASHEPVPALDDSDGLRASGNVQALSALRGLLAHELDLLADEWNDLRGDDAAMAGRLHRLRAACGFCGARALQSAAEKLSEALRRAEPECIEEGRAAFERALAATRAALRRS